MTKFFIIYFAAVIVLVPLLSLLVAFLKVKHTLPIIILVAIALTIPPIYGYNKYMRLDTVEETVVPDLVGQRLGNAEAMLEDLGLKAQVTESVMPASNIVKSHHPEAGMLVKRGRTIYIVLEDEVPPRPAEPATNEGSSETD
ncbi:MAG: PASTA domain-containing protein [Candidatus Margulisiibacteriota bacterium]|nr:PASTA domain-containing protein [Candidatus Margulisiibacteriota bacterium]